MKVGTKGIFGFKCTNSFKIQCKKSLKTPRGVLRTHKAKDRQYSSQRKRI